MDEVKKTHRNEPCHCGSGTKYKKCCMEKDQAAQPKNTFRDELANENVSEAVQLRRDQKLLRLQLEKQAEMHEVDKLHFEGQIKKQKEIAAIDKVYLEGQAVTLRHQIGVLKNLPYSERKEAIIENINQQIKIIETARDTKIHENVKSMENAIKVSAPSWAQGVYLATLRQVFDADQVGRGVVALREPTHEEIGKEIGVAAGILAQNEAKKLHSPKMGPIQTDDD